MRILDIEQGYRPTRNPRLRSALPQRQALRHAAPQPLALAQHCGAGLPAAHSGAVPCIHPASAVRRWRLHRGLQAAVARTAGA